MKVLHILDSLNRGGAETLALDICRNAKANGLDLIFVATGGGTLENELANSGTEFIRLQRKMAVDFVLVKRLRKIIKEQSVKIVHSNQAVEGLHLYLATIGLNVKRVLTFHGGVELKGKNLLSARFLIPRMDANIVVSKGLLRVLRDVNGLDTSKNFRVIYNGVDKKRLEPTGKNLKNELGIKPDDYLLGMIGNFYPEPRKDQMTICKSLPKVFNEFPNAHCVFVGGVQAGAEHKFDSCVAFCSENKIADRVHFPGGRDDVPDILSAMDLFIFSSLTEGLPIALAESMLANVPLVVSDIEMLLEASENGKYAEVFRVGDENDLAEKILKLMRDNSLREDLAQKALIYAQTNYSIEAHIQELKKLYESLLDKR